MSDYTIDPTAEQLERLHEVPRMLDDLTKGRCRPNVATVRRWRQRGIAGLRLPALSIGGCYYTSMEALRWWLQASAAARDAATQAAAALNAPIAPRDVATLQEAGIL